MEKLKKIFQGVPADSPIPKELLLEQENPLPTKELDRALFITDAARSFRFTDKVKDPVKRSVSKLDKELNQLDSISPFDWGIPGKTEEVISAEKLNTRIKVEKIKVTEAEAFVPETHILGLHPKVVFADTKSAKRNRLNRLVTKSANHTTIFGNDNRVNIYPNTYPESCICRVEVYTKLTASSSWSYQGRGTGFMVGRKILMTSGHMRPQKPYAQWMIKVIPAYYDGRSIYGDSFYTYGESYIAYQSDVGNDMMVVKLYDSIGDTTGYFGAKSYNSSWEDMNAWTMTGYPYDKGENRPTYQSNISVVDDDDGDDVKLPDGRTVDSTQIESYADEASGASGSPLYSWFSNGQMYAIGVHHGNETDWELFGSNLHSVASGGDMLPALVIWARNNWGN